MVKKAIFILLLAMMVVGCVSGGNLKPSDSQCLYRCGKCGRTAFMLNPLLRDEACPQGGTHQWRYNLNR